MTTSENEQSKLKDKQAKLLDKLQEDLANSKAQATSITNLKSDQAKILKDY
jgi:hypothetical protein